MDEFEILLQGLFRPEQVLIQYDAEQTLPIDAALSTDMERLWQEKLALARQRGVPLYDTPLFRFVEAEARANELRLLLGKTSYREYVVTREHAFASQRARQELANPLAVCSVVETSDGHILLDKREGVDVYVGRYHVIGGFFECHLDTDSQARPDPFAAMCRELSEETGVLPGEIVAQYCLGLVYDLLTPHAELCFFTQLALPLASVLARTPLDNEIKRLRSLEVTSESLRTFLLQHQGAISATGEPNLLLYGAWKFGQDWLAATLALRE